jgi:hypothetical protein
MPFVVGVYNPPSPRGGSRGVPPYMRQKRHSRYCPPPSAGFTPQRCIPIRQRSALPMGRCLPHRKHVRTGPPSVVQRCKPREHLIVGCAVNEESTRLGGNVRIRPGGIRGHNQGHQGGLSCRPLARSDTAVGSRAIVAKRSRATATSADLTPGRNDCQGASRSGAVELRHDPDRRRALPETRGPRLRAFRAARDRPAPRGARSSLRGRSAPAAKDSRQVCAITSTTVMTASATPPTVNSPTVRNGSGTWPPVRSARSNSRWRCAPTINSPTARDA